MTRRQKTTKSREGEYFFKEKSRGKHTCCNREKRKKGERKNKTEREGGGGGGDRETQTDRERETDRQTDRETHRGRGTGRDRQRQRQSKTERERDERVVDKKTKEQRKAYFFVIEIRGKKGRKKKQNKERGGQ